MNHILTTVTYAVQDSVVEQTTTTNNTIHHTIHGSVYVQHVMHKGNRAGGVRDIGA